MDAWPLALFILLLFLNAPVTVAIGAGALLFFLHQRGLPLTIFPQRLSAFSQSFPARRDPDVHLRRRDHESLRHHHPAAQSRGDAGRAHVGRAGADQRSAGDADGLRVGLRQRGRRDAVQDARRADGSPRLSAPVRRGDRRRVRGDHADDAARPRLRALRLSRQRFGGQALHGGHRAGLHHDDRPHGHHAFSLEALRLSAGSRPDGVAGRDLRGGEAGKLGADRPVRRHLRLAVRHIHPDRSGRRHRHLLAGGRSLRLSRAQGLPALGGRHRGGPRHRHRHDDHQRRQRARLLHDARTDRRACRLDADGADDKSASDADRHQHLPPLHRDGAGERGDPYPAHPDSRADRAPGRHRSGASWRSYLSQCDARRRASAGRHADVHHLRRPGREDIGLYARGTAVPRRADRGACAADSLSAARPHFAQLGFRAAEAEG